VLLHSKLNLGIYLLNFLEFYSDKLNFVTTGISCKGAGSFFNKIDVRLHFLALLWWLCPQALLARRADVDLSGRETLS
jgi:hypothetical protein